MVKGVTGAAWLCITVPILWFYWGPFWAVAGSAPLLGLLRWRRWGLAATAGLLVVSLLMRLEWEYQHVLPRTEQHLVKPLTVCLDQPAQNYDDYQAATVRVVRQPADLNLRRVRLTAPPEVSLTVGSCFVADFRLRQPLGRLIPGNFNATRYYFTQRIDALATLIELNHTYSKPTLPTRLYQRAEGVFQQDDALSVWAALALGWSKALDDPLAELFEQNQIKHLMVVSGMHVGMVGAWGFFVAAWMSR